MTSSFGRVVVTGAAGFLGGWLCRRLLADGWEVVAVDNFVTSSRAVIDELIALPRCTFLDADVTQSFEVSGPVDQVMHLASPASPFDYAALPVETMLVGSLGTRHALELAQGHGARFVLASTSEVYGDPLVHPQPETYWGNVNPVGPRSVYDEAKRFAEALTMAYRTSRGVDTGIARIFNTYGPGMRADDGRMIPAFMTQALRGEPVTSRATAARRRTLCFVSDTVRGCVRWQRVAIPARQHRGDEEVTVLQLGPRPYAVWPGHAPPSLRRPPGGRPACADRHDPGARQLGWRPEVGAEEGLARTLEWFEQRAEARRLAADPQLDSRSQLMLRGWSAAHGRALPTPGRTAVDDFGDGGGEKGRVDPTRRTGHRDCGSVARSASCQTTVCGPSSGGPHSAKGRPDRRGRRWGPSAEAR